MGGPEMAPHTPRTLVAPRRSRGAPRSPTLVAPGEAVARLDPRTLVAPRRSRGAPRPPTSVARRGNRGAPRFRSASASRHAAPPAEHERDHRCRYRQPEDAGRDAAGEIDRDDGRAAGGGGPQHDGGRHVEHAPPAV